MHVGVVTARAALVVTGANSQAAAVPEVNLILGPDCFLGFSHQFFLHASKRGHPISYLWGRSRVKQQERMVP